MSALGAAALGGGLSMLGQFWEHRQRKSQMNQTIRANRAMADLEWQRNKEMWSMQNEYNKPSAQMARFKEAGLNPNLIYGQGTPGNAPSHPQYNRPNEDHTFQIAQIAPILSTFQDMAVKKAQIDNLEANNARIVQSTATDAIRAASIQKNTAKTAFDLQLAQKLEENSLSVAQQNLKKIQADIVHTQSATSESKKRQRSLDLEYSLDKDLRPLGMTSRDPYLMRVITKLLLGETPLRNAIPNISNWRNR